MLLLAYGDPLSGDPLLLLAYGDPSSRSFNVYESAFSFSLKTISIMPKSPAKLSFHIVFNVSDNVSQSDNSMNFSSLSYKPFTLSKKSLIVLLIISRISDFVAM